MADFILEMHDIKKHFPGVQALKGVDFNVHQGEIHALVGQNGAGKSTLLKILAGIYIPEQGSIKVNGTELTKWNPQKIMDMGISFIYQELNLIQSMTVTQNLFIGSESRNALGLTDWKKMRARAKDALARIGVMDIDVNVPIRDLTVAKQQLVAIARALAQNPKLLVLDEPTSRLGFEDSEKLFEILKRMQRENISIIYVSHRLSEIYRIADRVTVLRDGKCIITDQTKAISAHELVKYMVGKDIQKNKFAQVKDHRNLLLQSTHLQGRANNVDLSIYGGEVLGLVGTVGAGKTEFVRMLFGIESLSGGTIEVNGKKLKKITPTEAIANGMALCPEDRKYHGLLLDNSIQSNITLAGLRNFTTSRFFTSVQKERDIVIKLVHRLHIATPSIEKHTRELSGGNQQKVVLAKWLCTTSKIFIFDEPTVGVDVQGKTEIYNLMHELADNGAGVLFVTSDVEEGLQVCDRIAVMYKGSILTELDPLKTSIEEVSMFAMGGHPDENR